MVYLPDAATAQLIASLMHLGAPGIGYDDALHLLGSRLPLVPRYRQKVRRVPGNLAAPVWVDDAGFDLTYHVRRSALPRPGGPEQLDELVARLVSRPLDRHRPLWEAYLVEGLADGGSALLVKTHTALVGGTEPHLASVLLDDVEADGAAERMPSEVAEPEQWRPRREPSGAELVAAAVVDAARRPAVVVDNVRHAVVQAQGVSGRLAGVAGGLLAAAGRSVRPKAPGPLRVAGSEHRRYQRVRTDLADYRRVRAEQARRAPAGTVPPVVTVNDVVLAVVAGGLRTFLLTRGEPMRPSTRLRAMVPVSVRPWPGTVAEPGPLAAGGSVSMSLVDLPVGEASPLLRLAQVSYATAGERADGRAVGADALTGLTGFAPPTLHALGARVAAGLPARLSDLVVINAPGPQHPLRFGPAPVDAVWPVPPLPRGQAVSIGLTSYAGQVYYGLSADRDGVPDLDVLAGCLTEALAELVAAVA